MKQFLIKIMAFALLVLVLPVVLIINDNLDKNFNSDLNIIALQNKSKFDSLDILFLGNSYCYSGIQPNLLKTDKIKALNLGIAASGVAFYEFILNDYLSHTTQNPKVIFVMVSTMAFSSGSDDFVNYPVHRYLETPISNRQIEVDHAILKGIIPKFERSLEKIQSMFLFYKHKQSFNIFIENRGFRGSDAIFNEEILEKSRHFFEPYINDEFQFEKVIRLRTLVESLEANGIQVAYLEPPTNLLNTFFNQKYLADYEIALQQLSKQNLLFRIDKNKFSSSDYRDIDHLNYNGSLIASEEIKQIIKANDKVLGLN